MQKMKLIKNLSLLTIIFLVCISCSKKPTISKLQHVGKIISAAVIPTSWNKDPKTQIKTTKGDFIVIGYVSILKGKDTSIEGYSDGSKYLFIDGMDKKYLLW